MRTRQRLTALRDFVQKSVCAGRLMKTPARDQDGREDITQISRQEPVARLGFYPMRPDSSGILRSDPLNVCPGILISQIPDNAKYVEDERFDRYAGIHRTQELGQWLNINFLFSIYEPGIRLPGFVQSAATGLDMSKFVEGTEEGVLTLADWIDDLKDELVAVSAIPGTDLIVSEKSITYGPLIESGYIADKRPIFYGNINVRFQCSSDHKDNKTIDQYLL